MTRRQRRNFGRHFTNKGRRLVEREDNNIQLGSISKAGIGVYAELGEVSSFTVASSTHMTSKGKDQTVPIRSKWQRKRRSLGVFDVLRDRWTIEGKLYKRKEWKGREDH